MRDLILLTAVGVPSVLAQTTQENLNFWERVAEKWGIGFVGLVCFGLVSWFMYKKDQADTKKRDLVDAASQAERAALLEEIRRLNQSQLDAQVTHSSRMEQLARDGVKANLDNAAALRMLVRKMRRPCVDSIDDTETGVPT